MKEDFTLDSVVNKEYSNDVSYGMIAISISLQY